MRSSRESNSEKNLSGIFADIAIKKEIRWTRVTLNRLRNQKPMNEEEKVNMTKMAISSKLKS